MKKLVLVLLLLSIPVSAVSFRHDYVNGAIRPDQFPWVTCERDKQIGGIAVSRDRACCINEDKNYYCGNNEPLLGTCSANLCLWPTPTYKPPFSARYHSTPCPGFAILAGSEYEPLLKEWKCTKNKEYWCCSAFAFPPIESGLSPKPYVSRVTENPKGSLLILDAGKWRALELGQFKNLKYEQRALEFEKQRCGGGGGSVRIVDEKYGSFFKDAKNIKRGMRVFFMEPNKVTPLVSWCEQQ